MTLTPEQLEERLPILRAACAGKVVQYQYRHLTEWFDAGEHEKHFLLDPSVRWRIKPEEPEVPGEVWVEVNPDGSVNLAYTKDELPIKLNPSPAKLRRYMLAEEADKAAELHRQQLAAMYPREFFTFGQPLPAAEHVAVKASNAVAKPTSPATKPIDGFVNIYPDGSTGCVWDTKEGSSAHSDSRAIRTARVVEVPERARERWIVESSHASVAFRDPQDAEKWQKAFAPSGCVIHVIEKA